MTALTGSAAAAEKPDLIVSSTVTTTDTTAELSASIDIHGGEETVIIGQASTDKNNWSAELVEVIPAGTTGVTSFTATIRHLEPNTLYYFRLLSSSPEWEFFVPEAEPFPQGTTTPTPPAAPVVSGEEVTNVGASDADLSALVNPERDTTTYKFEYLTKASFDSEGWSSSSVQTSGTLGPLPADSEKHLVSYHLVGLAPGVPYVWRVSAENSVGPAVGEDSTVGTFPASEPILGPCPNEAFRVGLSALVPNCRAYEQVTPQNKGGLNIQGQPDFLLGSPQSDEARVASLTSNGTGFPAGGGGRQDLTEILYSAGNGSWSAQRLFPPEAAAQEAVYLGASQNLRFALVGVNAAKVTEPKRWGLDLIDSVTGTITSVVPEQTEETQYETFLPDAISDDGSWVLFESRALLADGAAPFAVNLYRWARDSGDISTVGVLPAGEGGAAPAAGAFGGAYAWTEGETYNGGATSHQYVQELHAATSDGGQMYFTAGETGQVYLRRDLDGPTPTTVRVSTPNQGVVDHFVEEERAGEPFPAAFQEATPDGTHAFFLSREKLTADAATGETDKGKDLYVFSSASGSLVDVTGGLEDAENPDGARVVALLGASVDGSSGFFVAQGNLAAGAVTGERNIYRFEENSGAYDFSFVATLEDSQEEARNWSLRTYATNSAEANEGKGRTSRVTPDGKVLLFTSLSRLTAYNNNGCGFVGENAPCREIFMYDADRGKVTCVSCDPTGRKALGDAELATSYFGGVSVQFASAVPIATLTRNVSADGTRVFFQSPNSLVARDSNGASCRYLLHRNGLRQGYPTCMDVYEWEAPGTPGGKCTEPEVNGGCLYLLSAGDSPDASMFVDASADGSDAYIATTSPLVPTDRDQIYDIYDVRTNGGLTSQFTLPGPPCEEDACHGSAATPSPGASPGSAFFNGPGNVKPKHRKTCKKSGKKKSGKHCKKTHGKHKKKNHRELGRVGSDRGGK